MMSIDKRDRILRWLVKRFLSIVDLDGREVCISYLHNG